MSDVFGLAGFLRDDDLICHDDLGRRYLTAQLTREHIENIIGQSGQAVGRQAIAEVTYYVALPFVAADDGIAAGEPKECFNPNAAVTLAEALSGQEGHVGAVAFSRTGDPATGDFSDARVIRKFGDVPDDLSTL